MVRPTWSYTLTSCLPEKSSANGSHGLVDLCYSAPFRRFFALFLLCLAWFDTLFTHLQHRVFDILQVLVVLPSVQYGDVNSPCRARRAECKSETRGKTIRPLTNTDTRPLIDVTPGVTSTLTLTTCISIKWSVCTFRIPSSHKWSPPNCQWYTRCTARDCVAARKLHT
jgi:hypothetical protein